MTDIPENQVKGFRSMILPVTEIFSSIEGEGSRAGAPCTFIRLFGCNLKCSYCDSRYSWEKQYKQSVTDMSLYDIIGEVKKQGHTFVTLTGGEPLIHNNARYLLTKLARLGYEVNVETNGTIVPPVRHHNIFYTVDYKTTSSNEIERMNDEVFTSLRRRDVLKFVVGSVEDCVEAMHVLDFFKPVSQVYFSPVFGKIEPKEIVQFLLDSRLDNKVRFQLQLHKFIWDPDKRGV